MAALTVTLENHLAVPVHVAAVRHSASALEFVISRTRVPIPSGEVRHFDVDPGYALVLRNVPFEMQFSLSLKEWDSSHITVSHEQGFGKDGPYMTIALRPPELDAPEGPPDPRSLN